MDIEPRTNWAAPAPDVFLICNLAVYVPGTAEEESALQDAASETPFTVIADSMAVPFVGEAVSIVILT